MANILNIETSTEVCSVALTSDGMVLEHREDYEGRNHALLLSGCLTVFNENKWLNILYLNSATL